MNLREKHKAWRDKNPERMLAMRRRAAVRRPWAKSSTERRNGAAKRGILYTLRPSDLQAIWTGRCAITGLPFDVRVKPGGKAGPRPFSPSLDRIRPTLGYVPGNVRFILHCVNAFRGRMTDTLMRRVAERILKRA